MDWQFTPYSIVLFLAAAVAVVVAFFAWRRRAAPGGMPLALFLLAVTIWTVMFALEAAAVGVPAKVAWSKISYIGVTASPVLLLTFTLEYFYQSRWLTRRTILPLWIVPVASLGLAATNEWHHLIWTRFTPVSGTNTLVYSHGFWFWIMVAYTYVLLSAAAVLLIRAALRYRHVYRLQAVLLLIGVPIPWLGNILYVFGLGPFPGQDMTPVAFALAGLVLTLDMYRFQLLDLVPVARDKVIENMSDGVLVLDTQGRIVDANPAMLRLIGRSAGEVVGRPIAQILAALPDLAERFRDVPEAQDQIAVGEGETRRYFDLRISPLYGRQKKATGRVVVVRDTTERRRAEEALRQSNAELQARNEELDAFAHTVAHDLKNSLNSIGGYAQVLADGYTTMPGQSVQESLDIIAQTSAKTNNILDELMLLAGLRKQEVELAPLDMAAIAVEARRRLKSLIEERHAEILIPQDWPVALGYAPWVEEVWVNYISNAIQHSGEPPRVEMGATVGPDGTVCFWIRDNGRGLTPEEQARLFTPFTRLDQVRARGHGLGLSIVRRIVERMDGRVGVESRVGEGSTFTFTLQQPSSPDAPGRQSR